MALLKKPWVLAVAGTVTGIAAAFAVFTFVFSGGGGGVEAATPTAEPTPVQVGGKLGPHITLSDRVFNLVTSGGPETYLKLETVIEFETTDQRWAHVLQGCVAAFEAAPASMVSAAPGGAPRAVAPASGGEGGGGSACQQEEAALLAEFAEEIGSGLPLIEDAVTTIVSSKTAAEVATTEGKDALKAEIEAAVEDLLPKHHVTRVLFTNFITQ